MNERGFRFRLDTVQVLEGPSIIVSGVLTNCMGQPVTIHKGMAMRSVPDGLLFRPANQKSGFTPRSLGLVRPTDELCYLDCGETLRLKTRVMMRARTAHKTLQFYQFVKADTVSVADDTPLDYLPEGACTVRGSLSFAMSPGRAELSCLTTPWTGVSVESENVLLISIPPRATQLRLGSATLTEIDYRGSLSGDLSTQPSEGDSGKGLKGERGIDGTGSVEPPTMPR